MKRRITTSILTSVLTIGLVSGCGQAAPSGAAAAWGTPLALATASPAGYPGPSGTTAPASGGVVEYPGPDQTPEVTTAVVEDYPAPPAVTTTPPAEGYPAPVSGAETTASAPMADGYPGPTTEATSSAVLPATTASASAEGQPVMQQIDRAEQQWRQQAITGYRLAGKEVTFGPSFSFEITVMNGQVTKFACKSLGPGANACSGFDPKQYTVTALFNRARSMAGNELKRVVATFDPRYAYPASVRISDREMPDSSVMLTITAFEVLGS